MIGGMGFWLGVALGAATVAVVVIAARRRRTVPISESKTGLPSLAAWQALAARELARARRAHAHTAVLMIDIDHFKQVNDRHGHLAGDDVLKAIATTLTTDLRAYDVLARFGGDEFVALLPDTSAPTARTVAERLRARVESARPEDVLTVSIGIAAAPADGDTVAQLVGAADKALYEAKREGRNRVRTAAGQPNRGSPPR